MQVTESVNTWNDKGKNILEVSALLLKEQKIPVKSQLIVPCCLFRLP